MQEAPDNADELKRCVEDAFADAIYPGDDNITISDCDCAECSDTREFFGGKHWRVLVETDQNLMFLWGGLAIMSPEAWRFYLPAYLISGLGEGIEDWAKANKAEDARQAALWALSPLGNAGRLIDLFEERASGFTLAQQDCIPAYAQAMSALEPDEENYAAAAAFWKDRVVRTNRK